MITKEDILTLAYYDMPEFESRDTKMLTAGIMSAIMDATSEKAMEVVRPVDEPGQKYQMHWNVLVYYDDALKYLLFLASEDDWNKRHVDFTIRENCFNLKESAAPLFVIRARYTFSKRTIAVWLASKEGRRQLIDNSYLECPVRCLDRNGWPTLELHDIDTLDDNKRAQLNEYAEAIVGRNDLYYDDLPIE